jgi:hypothetical protein
MVQPPNLPIPDDDEQLTQWFDQYVDTVSTNSVHRPSGDQLYACPCCGYLTLSSRGNFEICNVCFWEDDGQDDHDANAVRGGPNGNLSLTQARQNFAEFGSNRQRDLPHVRKPRPDENPDSPAGV